MLLICDDPTKTGLYRNEAGEFSRVNVSLPALEAWRSFASWGDVDNDGDPDLLLSGRVPSQAPPAVLELFRNDEGVLLPVQAGLGGLVDGEAQWGDYDNDGDLDVVAFGGGPYSTSDSEAVIYKNESSRSNSPPSTPTNITARAVGNSIIISWDASTDAETPSAGLTYNVNVGFTSSGCEIMSAHANLTTGSRLVPAMGNVGFRRSHVLTNLPPGKAYYYRVQAVDAGYAGSTFSAPGVIAPAPVIETIQHAGQLIGLSGRGPAGRTCHLFVSTNLVTWENPVAVPIGTNGLWQFWEPIEPSRNASFYKVTSSDK